MHRGVGTLACLAALVGFLECPIARADNACAPAEAQENLAAIVEHVAPVSREVEIRRAIAQATFCLPQNALGILYYGLLSVLGGVVESTDMSEAKVVVTRAPFGVSLGKFLFLPAAHLAETSVRHEYGHTLQGYRHGPFYLVFEGAASFAQAMVSLFVPSFAVDYYERWPENEADALGGVAARSAG
jgi:hypothetical protein